ncbi:MAG: FG-GAP-like repeat-containing protein [Fulvivirga sp.]|uniref:MBG domain-containing protein n=2 Tax=Fulvivirga sp. TaxID=1931237 RepID=UPI0032EFBA17
MPYNIIIKYLLILLFSHIILFSNGQGIQFEQVFQAPPAIQSNPVFDDIRNSSVAFADVDGDLDQDVIITGRSASDTRIAKLFTNNGSGVFNEVLGTPFVGVSDGAVAFSDVDGDSDQDLIITGSTGTVRVTKLYINDGGGIFTEVIGTPFEGVAFGSVAFSDVDGDLDQDILITGNNSSITPITKLYKNNGEGVFEEVIDAVFEGVSFSSIASADIDGDTDQDIITTGFNSSGIRITKLYKNNGSGIFTEVIGTTFDAVASSSIAFIDVDGDLDQDLLITGKNSLEIASSKLYENDGDGVFTEIIGTPFEGVSDGSIAFADIDGDLDQDVFITGTNSSNASIAKLYDNDGNGVFTEIMNTPFDGISGGSIAFSDVDGDLDQDVLVTGLATTVRISRLYSNNGSGIFTRITGSPFNGVSNSSIAFTDVDEDLDQDVLITGLNSSDVIIAKLYSNNGGGLFTEVESTPFEGVQNSSIAFANIDGDSDQDLLIAGLNSSNERIAKLYENDGNGVFTEIMSTPFDGVEHGSIAFADIDGDLDQDLVITGLNSSNVQISKLYTNDGNGVFTEIMSTPFEGVQNSSLSFADIDGDLDKDLLITGLNSLDERITKLYENDGNGVFTEIMSTPFDGVEHGSVAFADIDGDLDQDLVITGNNTSSIRITKLYSNDGNGVFTQIPGTSFEGIQNSSIAFADVDGDSDQDLVIAGLNRLNIKISKIYGNDGSGVFLEIQEITLDGASSSSLALTDADGDSDLDVLITGNNNSNKRIAKLYVNKQIPTITFEAINKVYGDSDFILSSTSNSAGTITYSIVGDANGTTISGEEVSLGSAGMVTIRATQVADGNYTSTTKDIILAIAPKAIDVIASENQAKVYGNSDPTFTYIVTEGALEPGDSFTGLLSRDAGENVGTYALNIGTLSAGTNYNITFISADFTVTAKDLTVTADVNQSKVYGDSDPIFTYTVTTGALETNDSFTGQLSRAAGENVGSYAISEGTLSAGANYSITLISADFAIMAKNLTVTADVNQNKVYGDSDPIFTYKVTTRGLETNDSFSGSLSREEGEDVGTYAITVGTLSVGANYNMTFIGADFSITAKPMTITVDAGQTKVYGASDPIFTYTVTTGGLETNASFSGSLSREEGEDVGTYPITVGTLSAGANYNMTFIGADFSITASVTSIDNLEVKVVSIYPNPTSGELKFEKNNDNIRLIRVFDYSGKMLIEKTEIGHDNRIDLTSYKSGIYFIHLQTDKELITHKIQKN